MIAGQPKFLNDPRNITHSSKVMSPRQNALDSTMADSFDISSPANQGSEVYQTPKGGKAKLVAAKAKEEKKKKQAVPQTPPMPGAGSSSASGEPRRIEADLIAVGEVEEDKMERERPNGETEPGSQEIERKDQGDKEDTPDAYGADDEDDEDEKDVKKKKLRTLILKK